MKQSSEWIAVRQNENEVFLRSLVSAPLFPFDDNLKLKLPKEPGLYAISRRDARVGEYLHVGKNASAGLRTRIWDQHYKSGGKGANSDLIQKVQGAPPYFFGYPTDCAKMIFWFGCKFKVLASEGLSMLPRTTVASPSEAQ